MIPEGLAHLLGAVASVAIVRGSLVFCIAYAATSFAKRLPSAARHLVWLGVIGSFVLIPLAWLVLPTMTIGSGFPRGSAADWRLAIAPALSRVEYTQVIERTSVETVLTLRSPAVLVSWIPVALLSVWSVGAAALAGRLLAGTVRLRRLASGGVADARLQAFGERLAAELSMSRGFRIVLNSLCRIPFTLGVLNPVIMLPADATGWPAVPAVPGGRCRCEEERISPGAPPRNPVFRRFLVPGGQPR